MHRLLHVKEAVFWGLAAGIFGWGYLIGRLVFLYYLVAAIFFEGSWYTALWWFLGSGICKWIFVASNDHKIRVFFEDSLIIRGFTKKEAGAVWVVVYNEKGSAGLKEALKLSDEDLKIVHKSII